MCVCREGLDVAEEIETFGIMPRTGKAPAQKCSFLQGVQRIRCMLDTGAYLGRYVILIMLQASCSS